METNNDSNIITLVSDMPRMNNQSLLYTSLALSMESYKHNHLTPYPVVNPSFDHVDSPDFQPHHLSTGYRRVQALQELQREGTLRISNQIPIMGVGYLSQHVLSTGLLMGYESEARRQGAVRTFGRYAYIKPRDFQLLLGNAPKVAVSSLLRDAGSQLYLPVSEEHDWAVASFLHPERFFQTYYWDSGEQYEKREKALKEKIKSTSLYRANKPKGKQYYQMV